MVQPGLKVAPESIRLSPLTVADVSDTYVGWLNDPEVNRFLEVRHSCPLSRQNVVDFVKECDRAHRHHWGVFVDGVHVGNVSCSLYNRPYDWVNISNLIGDSRYHASNVAKLALAAAMEHLFSVCGFHRIWAGTYSKHFAGITLLTNLGFRKEGCFRDHAICEGERVDVLEFGILREEWQERASLFPKMRVDSPTWEQAVDHKRTQKQD